MPTLSKKHHYIPQFYLRGFTDDNGYFTVYDKQLNTFRKSRPENEFYKKFRNTTNLGGEKSVIVEEMYSYLESAAAITIAEIEKSSHSDTVITPENIIGLKFIVETMRWRNPALDDEFERAIKELSIKGLGFKFQGSTEEQLNEIGKRIMDEPEARKMLRPFISSVFLNSMPTGSYDSYKWYILYQDGGFPITGDFPIIYNPKSTHTGLDEEFILPLSSQRTLIVSRISEMKQLPDVFSINKDLAIIHLAKRFICCKRDDYLRFMVNYYKVNQREINNSFLESVFLDLSRNE